MTAQSPRAPTLTETLAQYWAAARYEDLPPESIRLAKRFLIDTLAAGIAGAHTDVAEIALRAVQTSLEGAAGSSVIWARTDTLPAPQAALGERHRLARARARRLRRLRSIRARS